MDDKAIKPSRKRPRAFVADEGFLLGICYQGRCQLSDSNSLDKMLLKTPHEGQEEGGHKGSSTGETDERVRRCRWRCSARAKDRPQ